MEIVKQKIWNGIIYGGYSRNAVVIKPNNYPEEFGGPDVFLIRTVYGDNWVCLTPETAKTIVECLKEAIDDYDAGEFNKYEEEWENELEKQIYIRECNSNKEKENEDLDE